MTSNLATLLVSCVDRKGIVATLAQALFAHGANILDADQHTDEPANMFFQRIRFDLGASSAAAIEDALAEVARSFAMSWRIAYGRTRTRVAIFVSKQEHCLYDLLVRHRAHELPCDIVAVVSNHDDARAIATHFGIPFHHIHPKHDAETFELLDLPQNRPDLIVLARYMQILSPPFVQRYANRIINIHHSFLPAFVGANPYRQAYDKGVKLIGATSHYVTADLDQGPIIDQETVPCSHRDTVDDLVRKGRDVEKRTLANAVRLHLEDRILVHANKTVVFDDKRELKAQLIAALATALEAARRAHQSAIEGAFHAEAKAENPKDTRGLEQSYLARGQAQRVAELEIGLAHVEAMVVDVALAHVTVGALVTVEDDGGARERYFIAPAGGGTQLGDVQVLTLSSPIGRALATKRLEDEVEVALPKQRRTLTIRDVT